MKPPRYLVIYNDRLTKRPRYFGPFVSERLAEEFKDELPGDELAKGIRKIETYQLHEIGSIPGL